jgi:Predicted amidohydrolase
MKIASIQLEMADGRPKAEAVDYARSMMDRCRGADLILLPEIWNVGFSDFDRYHAESEPLDGPTATAVAAKARELGAWVFSGSFVERREGRHYNTSVLFDREGRAVAVYRKIHLFTFRSREAELLDRGTEIAVADTEFGRIGLSTCYDLRFPELYRRMTDAGAEMFLVTAAWPYPRQEPWDIFNRSRAAENVCWLISCNAVGVQGSARFLGHSYVVDPWGFVVAASDFREGILRAEIDPGLTRHARETFRVLDDRVLG